MRVIVALLLAITVVAAYPKNQQRIVGGEPTTIDIYPEVAALLYSGGITSYTQYCAGTILNNRSILTASQCVAGDAPVRWRVRAGSTNANSGGVVFLSAEIIDYPSFNSATMDNDVAIIRVYGSITGHNIQPGYIAGPNYNIMDNEVVWAVGWGSTYLGGPLSEQLRHVQVWTVNQVICRNRYIPIGRNITDNMLCSGWLDVGGRDQCQGDTGGPLFHNKVVVGVRSFGQGCGLAAFPGVNTRVSRYTRWIEQNA